MPNNRHMGYKQTDFGENGKGHGVRLFSDTSGAYMEWDDENKTWKAVGAVTVNLSSATVTLPTGAVTNANLSDASKTVYNVRVRSTAAEVNAGKTLIAAVTGKKIRVANWTMIAIGGAAGGATSVDILGTQTTAQKLAAVAVAALTQSAVVTPNSTNVTVLADGASFVACDAGAAITIGKTGSNLTTATHIDVIISYTLE